MNRQEEKEQGKECSDDSDFFDAESDSSLFHRASKTKEYKSIEFEEEKEEMRLNSVSQKEPT